MTPIINTSRRFIYKPWFVIAQLIRRGQERMATMQTQTLALAWMIAVASFAPNICHAADILEEPSAATSSNSSPTPEGKSIAVSDLVRQARFGDPQNAGWADSSANSPAVIVSSDRKHAVSIVRFGDPKNGWNIGQLYLFTAEPGARFPVGKLIVERHASGLKQPVAAVRWLADGHTLMFASPDQANRSQVFSYDIQSGRLKQLTKASELEWFSATPDGKTLLVQERPQSVPPSLDPSCNKTACRIEAINLNDAERGIRSEKATWPLTAYRLGAGKTLQLTAPERQLDTLEGCFPYPTSYQLSPDGRFVVAECARREDARPESWNALGKEVQPDKWYEYQAMSGHRSELVLLDLNSGVARSLTDSPFFLGEIVWKDTKTVMVVGLLCVQAQQLRTEPTGRCVAEYDLDSGTIRQIGRIDAMEGDPARQTLSIRYRDFSGKSSSIEYRNANGAWSLSNTPSGSPKDLAADQLDDGSTFSVKQSYKDPPQLVVTKGNTTSVALDPNAWLTHYKLGHVELVHWSLQDGRTWDGELIYPVDYQKEHRYPLVIQTHGLPTRTFGLEGGLTYNYPGQALAARGIFVLQMPDQAHDVPIHETGIAEFTTVQAAYESAINYLSGAGLVDEHRVGIVGWSRSGVYEAFAIAHSSKRFAAAAFADTGAFGPMGYLIFDPEIQREFDSAFGEGKSPYGEGLATWGKWSPGMNIDKVRTPTLMWDGAVAGLWDWYIGLTRFEVPVEYWVLPNGSHVLFDVSQRIKTNELFVDWFCFWLSGETPADPKKQDQFRRWETMRQAFFKRYENLAPALPSTGQPQ